MLARLKDGDLLLEVSICLQQVEAPVEVVVEEEETEGQHGAAVGADPLDDRLVAVAGSSEPTDEQRGHLVGKVSDRNADHLIVAVVRHIDAHRPGRGAVGVERQAHLDTLLLEGSVAPVVEDEVLDGVVGDDHVGPAVRVQVHEGQAECFRNRCSRGALDLQSGFARDIDEAAVTLIAQKRQVSTAKIQGRAIRAADSRDSEVDGPIDLSRPLDVVANEEIQIPVVVGVEKPRARSPTGGVPRDAGQFGHVGEVPAVVAEQVIGPHRRDEQIGVAVRIVITDRDTHPVQAQVEARLGGDVLEVPSAVIAEECQGRWLRVIDRIARPTRCVDQQQIRVVVAVVVEEGGTRSHRLGHQLCAARSVFVNEVDSRCAGDVREAHIGRPLRQLLNLRPGRLGLVDGLGLGRATPQQQCERDPRAGDDDGDERLAKEPTDDGVVLRHVLVVVLPIRISSHFRPPTDPGGPFSRGVPSTLPV